MKNTTDKKLLEVQKKIEDEMQKEQDLDDLITLITNDVFERIISKGEVIYEVNGKEFHFKMKHTDKNIVIAASNVKRFKILQEKYKPYFIQAKIEEDIGFEKTLFACVEAFVRKEHGVIKAEEQS